MSLQSYKGEFIDFMARCGVLTFGDFTTKSGRKTPYFVNTGNYRTGGQMAELGRYYARCYMDNIIGQADILYGPAYKGIPLVVATVAALYQHHSLDMPYCFNRKEAKDHGEGGVMIGQAPKENDSIVIIEDVITAGTALGETMDLLATTIGKVNIEALIIQVDRMEKASGELSAVEEAEKLHGIKVHPIVTVKEIMAHLHNRPVDGKIYIDDAMLENMKNYLAQYGTKEALS